MKLSHISKVILLLLLPCFLLAQYPSNPVKQRLGWQTTGDGLVYRGSGAPAYSPGTMFNAWMYLDTTNFILYAYKNFQWTRLPVANNGLNFDGAYAQLGGTLIKNTTVETSTYDLLFGRTSGANHAWMNIFASGGAAGLFNSYQNGDYEAEVTVTNGIVDNRVENILEGGNSYIEINKDGFDAFYLHPSNGVSRFKMDSARFQMIGLPEFNTHISASSGMVSNGLYKLTNGRAIFHNLGAATAVSPNIQDNGTAVSILNSKPFSLGQWTTAGRPTGVDGYLGRNTSTGFDEGYYNSEWRNFITSTGASSSQSAFFSSAGQIAGSSNYTWDNTNKQLAVISDNSTNATRGLLSRQTNNGVQAALINFEKIRGSSAVQQGDIIGIFGFRGYSGSQYLTDNSLFGGLVTGSVTTSSVPTSLFFNTSASASNYNTEMLIYHNGNVGIGDFGSILSTITAPTYRLQVRGGDFQLDGENNNSERFVYVNNQNNGTSVRNGFVSWVGGNSGTNTERLFTMQAYAPAYTGAAFGGSFVAGNYVLAGLNFNVGSATNQRLHFALGSTSVGTTDTVEHVFNRFNHTTATTLSNSTRYASISNRGFQIPGTTTAGRVLSKVNQYWISYNTDSLQFNYRDNSGWHMLATRAYVRLLLAGLPTTNIYTANGTLTSNRTLSGGGFDLRLDTDVTIGDSLKVVGLADHTDPDSIVTTKGGWLGKRKWIMPSANTYDGTSSGYFFDSGIMGHQVSGDNYYHLDYADTTGYWEKGNYRSVGLAYSGNYGFVGQDFDNYTVAAVSADNGDYFYSFIEPDQGFSFRKQRAAQVGFSYQFGVDTASTVRMYLYGAGTKEAGDLSKTQSNYIAGLATDGTITDLALGSGLGITSGNLVTNQVLAEQFYEITSTSSPQTLSSSISDNLINQGSTQASFTLTFPPSPINGQILKITYNNAISSLTLDGNGNTIVGTTVTTAVAGSQRVFKFYTGIGWIRQN